MSEQHAFLPPSGSAVWVVCAAAPMMWQAYPETEPDQSSLDGTAAHWAASELLSGRVVALGQIVPNGVTLTDEMIEAAELYVENVLLTSVGATTIERRLSIPYVHEHNWGTPDAWLLEHYPSTGRATLYAWDFKFGHEYVDAFENWQLIDYVCGILDELQIDGHADQYIDVVMRVVQPRNYHRDGPVREWRVKAADLRGYFNRLKTAAELAFEPNPKATPNAGCKHCSGRHACAALQRSAYQGIDESLRSLPVDLPPAALGLEYSKLLEAQKRLEARLTGIGESILNSIKRGASIPGWTVAQGLGRQVWNKPTPEVIALGAMFQKDISKLEAITPVQAIKAGVDENVVNAYSWRPPGSIKLEPVNLNNLKKVFSNEYK